MAHDPSPSQPDSLDRLPAALAASQEATVAFLQTEIDIAFTMLDVARTQQQNRSAALEHARAAWSVVRQFEGRIQDPKAWRSIHARADELEAAINTFG